MEVALRVLEADPVRAAVKKLVVASKIVCSSWTSVLRAPMPGGDEKEAKRAPSQHGEGEESGRGGGREGGRLVLKGGDWRSDSRRVRMDVVSTLRGEAPREQKQRREQEHGREEDIEGSYPLAILF